MSENEGGSSEAAERARKGKRAMNPDDEQKEEDTADSSAVRNNQEPATTDKETGRDSDYNNAFVKSPSFSDWIPSLEPTSETAEQMIVSISREAKAREVVRAEIETSRKWKSEPAGCSSKKPKPFHPKDSTDPEPSHPADSTDPDPYLFKVLVTNSDCLRIPHKVAAVHFPPSSPLFMSSFFEQTIQLTDPLNHHWPSIGYVYFDTEKAFILTRNWAQYARLFDLQLMNTIGFTRPNACLGNNHFMTQHVTRLSFQPFQMTLTAFLPFNRLFKVNFGQGDVRLGFGRLVIDAYQVKKHFPGIRKELKQEMVKMTDYAGKDWFVKIVYSGFENQYIIMDDQWEGFVREHELVVGDLLVFYKPCIPSHDKHILIQFKREKGDELINPGKSDCVSDDHRTTKIQEEQFRGSPSLVPPGISDEDLALFFPEYDGTKSIDELINEQKKIRELNQLINLPLQISATSDSSKEDSDRDAQIQDYDTYSTDSDAEEDIQPYEQLIFGHQISEGPRLIIPYGMASAYFPPLMITPNAEVTLYLIDPCGERWQMTLIYDSNDNTYIITNGLNDYTKHNCLVPSDLIQIFMPIPQADRKDFYIYHQKNCEQSLFEVRVSRSNRLCIPCNLAENHFRPRDAPKSPNHLNEFELRITDYRDKKWEWKYVVFKDEESYIIIRGWDKYAAHHGLIHNDKIRFFKNSHPTARANSFIVHHELRRRGRSLNVGLVRKEELCWELSLTEADVGRGILMLNGFRIPSPTWRDKEIVKLTDWRKKDWYVIMVYQRNSLRNYLILDGWEDIVREHNLEAGDLMRIYEPFNGGDHDLHFVILFGKKRKRKEPEKKEDSGSGKPDDGGGPVEKILKLG